MSHTSETPLTTQGDDLLHILLVDDHPTTRLGTRTLIAQVAPNIAVSEAGSAAHALRLLKEEHFDLVFLDIKLPESEDVGSLPAIQTGKDTLQRIRELDGPPVVIMSGETDRVLIEDMMALGAATFVPKSADVAVSLQAIRSALAGGVWLPSEMIGKGGDSPPPSATTLRAPPPKPITHLDLGITPREFDVLHHALNGLTPLKISRVLGINHDNVRRYMARLYEKFGTANQSSLHAYFAKTGQTLGILQTGKKKPPPSI
jgi:DNA-binding NarL/FixJ family response regulator